LTNSSLLPPAGFFAPESLGFVQADPCVASNCWLFKYKDLIWVKVMIDYADMLPKWRPSKISMMTIEKSVGGFSS
jgi:hypothetical protein